MMGWIWCGMLFCSIIAAIISGDLGALTPSALRGAGEAVQLCIALAGPLCLWSGVAKVMEKAGLIEKIGRLLHPIFCRVFPVASRNRTTLGYLTANVSANLLGLGNAATPMGISAIRQMAQGERASDEMCLLIVLNSASVQLLPTTVAALRSSLRAEAPFDILPAVWLTSVCSVTAGLMAAKVLRRWL